MSRSKGSCTLGAISVVILLISVFTPWARAQGNFKTLHKFTFNPRAKGDSPNGRLIFDQAGNLYGTTSGGGAYDRGTVFKLALSSDGHWTETVVYSFTDGGDPQSTLTFDAAGNLYGTTYLGGASGRGTVFKLMPNSDGSWTESVLYTFGSLFNCRDGGNPTDSLTFDQAGNLYGTTFTGGSRYGCTAGGTVFKLTPHSDGTWSESVLHRFCSHQRCRDGQEPAVGVILDKAGNLYGTTWLGGNRKYNGIGCGTVFKLAPNADGSWTETVLHTFCSSTGCRDGIGPRASLVFDQAGNLYGTTDSGVHENGVVFQLIPNSDGTWTEKVLHNFNVWMHGLLPNGLTFDHAGNLYGTTFGGGYSGEGVVFKLAPNSKGEWDEKVLHAFRDHPGAGPLSGVIFDTAGNLYGTTPGDSFTTYGSVYEITP